MIREVNDRAVMLCSAIILCVGLTLGTTILKGDAWPRHAVLS